MALTYIGAYDLARKSTAEHLAETYQILSDAGASDEVIGPVILRVADALLSSDGFTGRSGVE